MMVGTIYKTNFDPEKVAINFKGDRITYEQLDQKVLAYAAYLKELGLKKDDKVVLSCLNSPEFIYSYFGTVRNGAVIVPINLMLTMEEISYVVKDSGAKFMLVQAVIMKKMKLSKENIEATLGIKVLILDDDFEVSAAQAETEGFVDFADVEAVSTFLYTSGTTGKPKAAMLSHRNLVRNAEQSFLGLETERDDHFLCVLPMFHVFAFTACILLPLWSGATITILEMFQPKEVVDCLQNGEITIFMGVPAMYVVLLDAGKKEMNLSHLRLAVSGGAALPVEVYKQCREILQLPLIEGYGLTEAAPVAAFNPRHGVQKAGSIGLPVPQVECRVVNEQDAEVPAGEVGELVIRGDNVMLGYYNQPEQTAEALRDGWLYTGDLAKTDEEGYIYIVDRKKDLVIVAGMNVYPREIEEVLYEFPKVKEAAVVGEEDRLRGECVKAFVVLKEGEECSAKELRLFLKTKLAVYKLPRTIEFVPHLPKNSSGKILRRMLKEQKGN